MDKKSQQEQIQHQFDDFIKGLESLYIKEFEKLVNRNMSPGLISKASQRLLQSREGAIYPLKTDDNKEAL